MEEKERPESLQFEQILPNENYQRRKSLHWREETKTEKIINARKLLNF